MNPEAEFHYSVLLEPVLEFSQNCESVKNPVILDGTLGAGGHTIALFKRFPNGRIYASDRDPAMVEKAMNRIAGEGLSVIQKDVPHPDDLPGIYLITESFRKTGEILKSQGMHADFILLDLGVSIHHFRDLNRGFSYTDEILDMRLSPDLPETASDILIRRSEKELEEIFSDLGEEKFSGRIARNIKENLPLNSAKELAEIIMKSVPHAKGRENKIHPATRVFQALRIYVNRELIELEEALDLFPDLLNPGGRLAVISFHSLEDRIVKNAFKKIGVKNKKPVSEKRLKYKKNDALHDFIILTPNPLLPDALEIRKNPPSRSAKLRVIEKIHRK